MLALPSPADMEKETVNKVFQEYKSFMEELIRKRGKKILPAKISSLQNDICTHSHLKGSNKQKVSNIITKVINKLSQQKLLKVTGNKVSYP